MLPDGGIATPRRTVGILLFDEVEVLDFAGPFEVFSVAGRRGGLEPFHVVTVAETDRPVLARNGLSINPHHTISDCPPLDLLVVPGGYGVRRELWNEPLIEWIGGQAAAAELVLSVCTGAALLGRAGLLAGLAATTHHSAFDLLEEAAPRARIERGLRYVDNGRILLSAGVSAGIDLSLHIVARLLGLEVAEECAHYMEYRWQKNPEPE